MKKIILIFAVLAGLLAAMVVYVQLGMDAEMPYEMAEELGQPEPSPVPLTVSPAVPPTVSVADHPPATGRGETLNDPFLAPPPFVNTAGLRLEGTETVLLEIAGNYSAASFGSTCIQLLKVTLEDWSGGRIRIIHYTDTLLGSDKDIFKAVQLGNLAMGLMTSAPQYGYIPEVAVFDMGGYALDYNAAAKTMRSGPFREAINAAYAKAGMELVALFPTSFRELGADRPVRTVDDLRGLRIRVMENPLHAEFWRLMGADPVQMPMSDSYISLQQKLLNASENPLDTLLAYRINEQSKFFTETHHILFNNTIICNRDTWNSLPEDYRAMIAHVAKRVSEWGIANGPLRTKLAIEKLQASGCEIIPLSEKDRERMREAAKPLYETIREKAGNELVDLWISELQKNANGN